jgi:hypothetical protein
MTNKLFEFTVEVLRGEGCDMPDGMTGAFIPTYAAATDPLEAVRLGVKTLQGMHYQFKDLKGTVREIPAASWEDYIEHVWPEFVTRLPSASELPVLVERGAVFFGPFAGFERPA